MKAIRTPLCTLEPLVELHAHEMFRVLSDPAIYEFENKPPVSEDWLTHRYRLLESRSSPDGTEAWLNWVIRRPTGELAGYVQATVAASGTAYVAYELSSPHWRQGIGKSAVGAMLDELNSSYAVHTCVAILKSANYRSMALLVRLGFRPASPSQATLHPSEADESIMIKTVSVRKE